MITDNWLIKSVLGFTLEKMEKSSFQKIIEKFLDGFLETFSPEIFNNDVKNKA